MSKTETNKGEKHASSKYYTSISPKVSNKKELIYFAKDNFWSQDFFTTASSNFLTDFRLGQNATVIKLLGKKGYKLLGKTVLDELSCGGTGLYANTGPISNPYNSLHIAGGSSSGSAMAIVKKLTSFALGSDTGGSIRHPAAYCGVIGFKPSWGSISRYGLIPMASSLDTVGILASSVNIIHKIFSLIARPDSADLLTIVRYNRSIPLIPTKKIAVLKDIEIYLSPPFAQLYQETVAVLKKENYQIESITIPRDIQENLQICWLIICFSELTSHLNSLQGITYGVKEKNLSVAQKRSKYLGKVVKQRLLVGAYFLQNPQLLEQAYSFRQKIKKWSNRLFRQYTFLIFPSTNSEAPPIDQTSFLSLGSKTHWSDNLLLLASLSGLPSLSLPIGFSNGLPVSININSAYGNDQQVLELASKLEKEMVK
jgi:aspartyl-tRNA(Asn)/glutamyl-tRNA(Gln) amidotransferase subunit A